jgi:hypothetical protein
LAISNIKGIDQNWLNGNFESLDSATRGQIEAVKQEVNYQNAANIALQNGRVFANPGQAGQSLYNTTGQVGQAQAPAQLEAQGNALLQWNKLEQAQELAVARVQPLRVNLPTRGLHHAFTQILQTEVDKPLSIQFSAANTRTGGLLGRLAGCVLGLILLWILVKVILNRCPRERQAA